MENIVRSKPSKKSSYSLKSPKKSTSKPKAHQKKKSQKQTQKKKPQPRQQLKKQIKRIPQKTFPKRILLQSKKQIKKPALKKQQQKKPLKKIISKKPPIKKPLPKKASISLKKQIPSKKLAKKLPSVKVIPKKVQKNLQKTKTLKPALVLLPEKQELPQKKKLKINLSLDEVISFFNYAVSPELRKLILILESKDIVSETEIAEKLNIKINGARKLLYILREWGFADYEKKSDEQKSWWFIYFWSLNKEKILNRYIFSIQNEIRKREELVRSESDYSFSCHICGLKYTYQEALEKNFECADCDGVLDDLNNEAILGKIRAEIQELNARLERVKSSSVEQ